MTTASLARASFGALALTVLAGCGGTANFTIDEVFTINGTGEQTDTIDINLATLAGDAWDHRDKIKDGKITAATAVIETVIEGNTAETVSGEARVVRPGQSVVFASGTNLPVVVGTAHAAQNLDATADVILDALDGDGTLAVTYTATPTPGGAATRMTVRVLIDVEVEWKLF